MTPLKNVESLLSVLEGNNTKIYIPDPKRVHSTQNFTGLTQQNGMIGLPLHIQSKHITVYFIELFEEVIKSFKVICRKSFVRSMNMEDASAKLFEHCQIFQRLIALSRTNEQCTPLLSACLKFGRVFVQNVIKIDWFLLEGLVALPETFLGIITATQIGTRLMHTIASLGRKRKIPAITQHIPLAKQVLESFIVTMKKVSKKSSSKSEVLIVGLLKNKLLDGTVAESSDDESANDNDTNSNAAGDGEGKIKSTKRKRKAVTGKTNSKEKDDERMLKTKKARSKSRRAKAKPNKQAEEERKDNDDDNNDDDDDDDANNSNTDMDKTEDDDDPDDDDDDDDDRHDNDKDVDDDDDDNAGNQDDDD
jgi:hypothetical protein